MAFAKNIIDLRGILTLMVFTLPSIAANIDCNGKAFHCVNSTHFMICVDLGSGVSSTMDDFVIPCPPTTVCQASNKFECEFPVDISTTVASSVATLVTSGSETIESVTSPPYDVITSFSVEHINTVSTATLYEDVLATHQTVANELTSTESTTQLMTDVSQNKDTIIPELKLNETIATAVIFQDTFTTPSPSTKSTRIAEPILDVTKNENIIIPESESNMTLNETVSSPDILQNDHITTTTSPNNISAVNIFPYAINNVKTHESMTNWTRSAVIQGTTDITEPLISATSSTTLPTHVTENILNVDAVQKEVIIHTTLQNDAQATEPVPDVTENVLEPTSELNSTLSKGNTYTVHIVQSALPTMLSKHENATDSTDLVKDVTENIKVKIPDVSNQNVTDIVENEHAFLFTTALPSIVADTVTESILAKVTNIKQNVSNFSNTAPSTYVETSIFTTPFFDEFTPNLTDLSPETTESVYLMTTEPPTNTPLNETTQEVDTVQYISITQLVPLSNTDDFAVNLKPNTTEISILSETVQNLTDIEQNDNPLLSILSSTALPIVTITEPTLIHVTKTTLNLYPMDETTSRVDVIYNELTTPLPNHMTNAPEYILNVTENMDVIIPESKSLSEIIPNVDNVLNDITASTTLLDNNDVNTTSHDPETKITLNETISNASDIVQDNNILHNTLTSVSLSNSDADAATESILIEVTEKTPSEQNYLIIPNISNTALSDKIIDIVTESTVITDVPENFNVIKARSNHTLNDSALLVSSETISNTNQVTNETMDIAVVEVISTEPIAVYEVTTPYNSSTASSAKRNITDGTISAYFSTYNQTFSQKRSGTENTLPNEISSQSYSQITTTEPNMIEIDINENAFPLLVTKITEENGSSDIFMTSSTKSTPESYGFLRTLTKSNSYLETTVAPEEINLVAHSNVNNVTSLDSENIRNNKKVNILNPTDTKPDDIVTLGSTERINPALPPASISEIVTERHVNINKNNLETNLTVNEIPMPPANSNVLKNDSSVPEFYLASEDKNDSNVGLLQNTIVKTENIPDLAPTTFSSLSVDNVQTEQFLSVFRDVSSIANRVPAILGQGVNSYSGSATQEITTDAIVFGQIKSAFKTKTNLDTIEAVTNTLEPNTRLSKNALIINSTPAISVTSVTEPYSTVKDFTAVHATNEGTISFVNIEAEPTYKTNPLINLFNSATEQIPHKLAVDSSSPTSIVKDTTKIAETTASLPNSKHIKGNVAYVGLTQQESINNITDENLRIPLYDILLNKTIHRIENIRTSNDTLTSAINQSINAVNDSHKNYNQGTLQNQTHTLNMTSQTKQDAGFEKANLSLVAQNQDQDLNTDNKKNISFGVLPIPILLTLNSQPQQASTLDTSQIKHSTLPEHASTSSINSLEIKPTASYDIPQNISIIVHTEAHFDVKNTSNTENIKYEAIIREKVDEVKQGNENETIITQTIDVSKLSHSLEVTPQMPDESVFPPQTDNIHQKKISQTASVTNFDNISSSSQVPHVYTAINNIDEMTQHTVPSTLLTVIYNSKMNIIPTTEQDTTKTSKKNVKDVQNEPLEEIECLEKEIEEQDIPEVEADYENDDEPEGTEAAKSEMQEANEKYVKEYVDLGNAPHMINYKLTPTTNRKVSKLGNIAEMTTKKVEENSNSNYKSITNIESSTINGKENLEQAMAVEKTSTKNEFIETVYKTSNVASNNKNSTVRYSPVTKSLANIHNTSPSAFEPVFVCKQNSRGRFSDSKDCRKFYICTGRPEPIPGLCPNNTVFSELRKQCTKNLSHCVRNNQFQCVWEGRFTDFFNDNIYYICVKNKVGTFIRFKLQCQSGYHLNKTSIRCALNTESSRPTSNFQQSTSDISKNSSDQSVSSSKSEKLIVESAKKFDCKKEGKFPDTTDCRKYYVCSKNRRSQYRQKKKKCDSDELFHKDKKKCVDADSYECS